MIVAIIGPHGVGKTTLGVALAKRLAVPFDDEIGRRLAQDPRLRPAGVGATASQPSFDERVLAAEVSRDAAYPADCLRVVESWHPGNLAFTSLRSPHLTTDHLSLLRQHLRSHPAVVVLLRAPRHVLRARQTEPGALSFFLEVGCRAEGLAHRLGLPVLAKLSTHGMHAEDLAAQVAGIIHSQG